MIGNVVPHTERAPLVLLPGMMCDARLFAPQIAAFSAQRVLQVAPMLRDSTARIAEEVLAHAPPRFALAGLSMGGIVAMEIAAIAPERLAGIALLDTNPMAEVDAVKAARIPQIEAARAGRLGDVMRHEMKPRYLVDSAEKQAILNLCMDMALTLGRDVFEEQSRALRDRPDRQDVLTGLDIPALVLMGREDSLCPLDRHELMHDLLPDSTLVQIDGAGHLPVLEQPQPTNAALVRWLERCDG